MYAVDIGELKTQPHDHSTPRVPPCLRSQAIFHPGDGSVSLRTAFSPVTCSLTLDNIAVSLIHASHYVERNKAFPRHRVFFSSQTHSASFRSLLASPRQHILLLRGQIFDPHRSFPPTSSSLVRNSALSTRLQASSSPSKAHQQQTDYFAHGLCVFPHCRLCREYTRTLRRAE